MSGYDLADSDLSSLLPKYKCVSCKRLLRDTMQTSCGHFYCFSCLPNLVVGHVTTGGSGISDTQRTVAERNPLSSSMKCLVCGTVFTPEEVFPDNIMRREIMHLVVHCTYVELGCKWIGELKDLELHYNDCPGFPVVCAMCNKEGIPLAKIQEHQDPLTGDCDGVEAPCPFLAVGCKETKVMSPRENQQHTKELMTSHLSLLLETVLSLSRDVESLMCCTPELISTILSLMDDYKNTLIQVQGVEGEQRDLRGAVQRLQEQVKTLERCISTTCQMPTDELAQRMMDLENWAAGHNDPEREQMEIQVHGSHDEGEQTEHYCPFKTYGCQQKQPLMWQDYQRHLRERTASHLELLRVEISQHQATREEVDWSSSDTKDAIERRFEELQETIRRLERKVESHEHVLAIRNVALEDLEEFVRQQQVSSYDGALLWKIDDYARRKNDAVSGRQTSFYSPCFYTSRHGYKMCARMYLNGDGIGEGTHISVFFVVMRGKFDALLRWPFRQKITIMLWDQDDVEHVVNALAPDPNSAFYQIPRSELSVVSGFPRFCRLSELDKHAYVKEDAMIVRIFVGDNDDGIGYGDGFEVAVDEGGGGGVVDVGVVDDGVVGADVDVDVGEGVCYDDYFYDEDWWWCGP